MPADDTQTSAGLDADGVVRVRGPLTFASVPGMAAERPRWLAGGQSTTVDLGLVTRVDSAGLALMLDWLAMARAAGSDLHFTAAPAQLLAIARTSGLAELFGDATPQPED